jgi:hypothetical protein
MHATSTSGIHDMTSTPHQTSKSLMRPKDVDHTFQPRPSQPVNEGIQLSRASILHHPHHPSQSAMDRNTLSETNLGLLTQDPDRTDRVTAENIVNKDPTDLPAYLHGWQAKMGGQPARTSHINASIDLAPSSSTVAPSVVDKTHLSSSNLARTEATNNNSTCINLSSCDFRLIPLGIHCVQDQTMGHNQSLPTQLPAIQQSSLDDSSAVISEITKLPCQKGRSPRLSGPVPDVERPILENEAQRIAGTLSTLGLNIPQSPLVSGATTESADECMKNHEQDPPTWKSVPSKSNDLHDSATAPPVRKLCRVCRKLILGSTSTCTKCREVKVKNNSFRSEQNPSSEHASVVDVHQSPASTMLTNSPFSLVSNKSQPIGKGMNKKSSIKSSTPYENVPSLLLKGEQNRISPESPCVPETPDLVFLKESKSFGTPYDEKVLKMADQGWSPQPLIPQKRTSMRFAVADNEHVFSKKKPRIFRPTKSITINVPPAKLDTFPPTPKSGSPQRGHSSRDVSVQTSVETVHRGTSPISEFLRAAESLESPRKDSASHNVQFNQTTFPQSEISVVDGAQGDIIPGSPDLSQKSGGGQIKVKTHQSVEKQAAESAHMYEEYEQAQATIDRLCVLIQKDGRPSRQESSAAGKGFCKAEYHVQNTYQRLINSDHLPVENSCRWTASDEKTLLKTLQSRGVTFEEDSSSESEVGIPPPRSKPIPNDPLWQRPQSSTDLFVIAPSLDPNHHSFDAKKKRKEIATRPSRKERRMNIHYLRQERGDDIHEEVQRPFPPRMVKATSMTPLELGDSVEKDADRMNTERRTEVDMTFSSFIGAPAKPMAILTKDKQLAFRDGTRDMKGDLPRAREKFIVTNRSVICMEG